MFRKQKNNQTTKQFARKSLSSKRRRLALESGFPVQAEKLEERILLTTTDVLLNRQVPSAVFGETDSDTPTIVWSQESEADGYQVLVYHVNTGSEFVNVFVDGGETTEYQIRPPILRQGTYQFFVRPFRDVDQNGIGLPQTREFGLFSLPEHFSVNRAQRIFGAPSMTGPISQTNDNTPVMAWSEVEGAETYRIHIYDQAAGKLIQNEVTDEHSYFAAINALPAGKRYTGYARVETPQFGAWSPKVVFDIESNQSSSQAEIRPILTGPMSEIHDSTPNITWKEITEAVSYRIELYDVDAGQLVRSQDEIDENHITLEELPLLEGNYQVFVRANFDNNSVSVFSRPLQFKITSNEPKPAIPFVTSPVSPTPHSSPTFIWNEIPGGNVEMPRSPFMAKTFDIEITSENGDVVQSKTGIESRFYKTQPLEAGHYAFRARGVNRFGERGEFSEPYHIEILQVPVDPNLAPEFTTFPTREVSIGEKYEYDSDAIDPDNDELRFELLSGPELLSVDEQSGMVTWDPIDSDLGMHSMTLLVEDGRGGFDEQNFSLNVISPLSNRPPAFTSFPLTESVSEITYQYDATAIDPDSDVLAYELLEAPAEMFVDVQTGLVEWAPTVDQIGTHPVTLQASDHRGGLAVQEYVVSVGPDSENNSPVIVSDPVTKVLVDDFIEGAEDDLTFTVPGVPGEVVDVTFDWTIRDAAFNNEFGIFRVANGEGLVDGFKPGDSEYAATALSTENSQVIFKSGEGVGATKQSSLIAGEIYSFYIIQANTTEEWRSTNPTNSLSGSPLAFFSFQDANPDDFDHLRATVLDNGQTQFAWEDLTGGGDQDFTDVVFTIDIALFPGSRKLYEYDVHALDADHDSLEYSLISSPANSAIDTETGLLSFITETGLFDFTVQVTDGRGGIDLQSFTLEVSESGTGAIRGTKFEDLNMNGVRDVVNVECGLSSENTIRLQQISTIFNNPVGIDYHEPTNSLVLSVNFSTAPRAGQPRNFERIEFDGTHIPFSDVSGFRNEIKIAAVRSGNQGGFETGDLFTGNGVDGQIVRITGNGDTVINPWVDLPGSENGLLRGSLYVDRTGVYGEDLIVVTTAGEVWRIDSDGNPRLIADVNTNLEGVITVPNDISQYGPLAGKIIAGNEVQRLMYAFDDLGNVQTFDLGVSIEDIDIIPPGENFFGVNFGSGRILGASASDFACMAGDILLTEERFSPGLHRLFWDGSQLQAEQLLVSTDLGIIGGWEHVTFAPAGVNPLTSTLEPGLENFTIYLDQNQNGLRDFGESFTTTNENGDYEFTGLPEGTYYVREEQQAGWVQTILMDQIGNNLIQNGSFEIGPDPGTFSPKNPGDTSILGWTITDDQIDYIRATWQASDGVRSLDLYGSPGVGAVSQQIETIPGQHYLLTFDMAGNFGTPPALKEMQVTVADKSATYQFDVTGQTAADMGWQPHQLQFTAIAEQTLVEFASLLGDDPGDVSFGPALDNVAVFQLAVGDGGYVVDLAADQVATEKNFGNYQVDQSINFDPSITSDPPLESAASRLYRYDVTAFDLNADALTFDLSTKPEGMAIDRERGTVVWIPGIDQIGSHDVIVRVSDGRGGVGLKSYRIEVSEPNASPLIISTPPNPAVVEIPYVYSVVALDRPGDTIDFSLLLSPEGMTINSVSGKIEWIPQASQLGNHDVLISVRDQSGAETLQSYSLEVVEVAPNDPPEIVSSPRTRVRFGDNYFYRIEAFDPNGDPLQYRLVESPEGMTVDNSGMVHWVPTDSQLGFHDVGIEVDDGRGGIAQQSYEIRVVSLFENLPPEIVSDPPTAATAGRQFQYQAVAFDPDNDPVVWVLESSPLGMLIDPNSGILSWQPSIEQLGTQSVTIIANDPYLRTASQSFALTVRSTDLPPVITSFPKTDSFVGETYTYAIEAHDPEGDKLSFLFTGSPDGMTIDPNSGNVQWIPQPDQVGSQTVGIQVQDSQGSVSTQNFTVNVIVDAPNQSPIFTSSPSFVTMPNEPYEYEPSAIDPEGDLPVIALLSVPEDMQLDENTGLLSWTPIDAQLGQHEIVLVAVDSQGTGATQRFSLIVEPNDPPEIVSAPPTRIEIGQTLDHFVLARDPNGDPLSFSFDIAPDGMSIGETGRISWSPQDADLGSHNVSVRVSDDHAASITQIFVIEVVADDSAPSVELLSSSNLVDVGQDVVFQIRALDNVGIETVSLSVDGIAIPIDNFGTMSHRFDSPGLFDVVATATDAAGNTGSQTIQIRALAPTDDDFPFVEITSPSQNGTVTYLTDIVGTVTDENLEFFHVQYARVDQIDLNHLAANDSDWVTLATSTVPAENAVLATFDPTLLQNDSYVIRVIAQDINGLIDSRGVIFGVEGNAKLGNFSLEFTDLSIPLAGIPITITRSYDTLQANDEGTFGFGWTLGLKESDIRETVPDIGGGFFTQAPFRAGTRVFITNPEGDRVGFTFDPEPRGSLFGTLWRPRFTPDPGVTETLIDPDAIGFILSQRGDGTFGGFLGIGNYNASNYVLTTAEGLDYRYSQSSGLERIDDQHGNQLTFTEDGIFHSSGVSIDFLRDSEGRIEQIIDPDGNTLVYEYDAAGDLRSFTNQENLKTQFGYLPDRGHFLDSIIDPLGKTVLDAEFDESGRLTSTTNALGFTTRQEFDPSTFTGTFTDANGNVTVQVFNERGNVLEDRDPEGGITRYRYDDPDYPDLETSITDPRGFETRFTFNERGNLTNTTDSLGLSRNFAYLPSGDLATATDQLGRVTTFRYDTSDDLTEIVDAAGNSARITYDEMGRIKTQADRNGNTTAFEYETTLSVPSLVTNPDGSQRRFEYNRYGQVTKVTNELGNEFITEYDALGRRTRELGPDGQESLFEYQAQLLVKQIDKISETETRTTSFEYNDADLLVRQIDAEGGVTQFDYDKVGNRTLIVDPVGNRSTFEYDRNNRLIAETDPLGNVRSFEYDEAGNRIAIVDRNDRRRTFEFDELNRLIEEDWYDIDSIVNTIGSTYDAVGNLLTQSDEESSYTFSYDVLNRQTSVDNVGTPDASHVVLTYEYDAEGNRTLVSDNMGISIRSEYDQDNQLISKVWAGADIDDAKIEFDYDESGNRIETRRYSDAAGTDLIGRTVTGYDGSGRTASIEHVDDIDTVYANYDYTYDLLNRLSQEEHHSYSVDYDYDRTDQLLSADYENLNGGLFGISVPPDEFYDFDLNGNRTASSVNGNDIQTGLANRTESDGTFDYVYDNEGNLISKTEIATGDVTEYEYDHRNRLSSVVEKSAGGVILSEVEFTYDVYNRRIAKTVNGLKTHFVYDGDNVWADFDANGDVIARYLFGDEIDEILARYWPSEGTAWYLTDRLGTVRDIVNNAHELIHHIDYNSFGQIVNRSFLLESRDRFSFQGREFDSETGLFYFRARYYDPALGRFISEDPLRFEVVDSNLQRFLGNNPVNAVDPQGTTTVEQGVLAKTRAREALKLANASVRTNITAVQKILLEFGGGLEEVARIDALLRRRGLAVSIFRSFVKIGIALATVVSLEGDN